MSVGVGGASVTQVAQRHEIRRQQIYAWRQKPASGAVFAFRGRRGDRIKLLYWDGQGFCLCYKVLERCRFPWPSAQDGAVRMTSAQLAMLDRLAASGLGGLRLRVWGDFASVFALFIWCFGLLSGNQTPVETC
ncbi:hypothetical protein ROLI_028220 [Roseobacter fucihabitans]|uniref:Transposase n=2 Tax=Roseobacter fucihabitans TaxID=1537242 RepID=A0ABZ2BL89_9RHOB|nr:IS66 Orf2 like protein [Roseobacter litoralis]MBC6963958.1 IS66 Orf2 like protein [Roseobacter litoralis]